MMREEWASIIDDPLAWQAKIDTSGLGPNMRGSARFWRTVAERLGREVRTDGAPEFSTLLIDLGGGVALRLYAGDESPWLGYAFCAWRPEEMDPTGPAQEACLGQIAAALEGRG